MNASGRDVGGDEHVDPTAAEGLESTGPLGLAPPTMDGGCFDVGLVEPSDDTVHDVAGPTEHDGLAVLAGHPRGVLQPIRRVDDRELVAHQGEIGFGRSDLVASGVALVLAGQHVDVAVERGRKQDGLAVV